MAAWERRTVLLIEPDEDAARAVVEELATRYRVAVVRSAAAARAWLGASTPAAIVLELALPDTDGLIFCAQLRARTFAPLLVHSSLTGPRELVLSLRLGADDFVAKPALPGEIEARIGALLRRADRTSRPRNRAHAAPGPAAATGSVSGGTSGDAVQKIGDLTIDREGLSVSVAGRLLYLTASELRVLLALSRHVNEPLSRAELARLSGGPAHLAGSRSLDMHVRRLRAKLRAASGRVPGIVPVRGFGYRMVYAGREEAEPPAA